MPSLAEEAIAGGRRSATHARPARSLKAALGRLRGSIPKHVQGDYVMAANRLIAGGFMLFAACFLGPDLPIRHWALPIVAWIACGIVVLVQLRASPDLVRVRRSAAIVLDVSGTTIILIAGGESTAFIYVVYLWIIIGNGFRFGKSYIFAASLASIAGFSAGILLTPFWRMHLSLSLGLLFGIIVLPAYSFALIRQIAEARRAAERADQAKSLFLASVSHELRTPLNAIIGTAELLSQTKLNSDQAEMIATIANAADGQLSLVKDVLQYSRIEAGHGRNETAGLDLAELFSVVRAIVAVGARKKGLLINGYITASTPLHLLGDERHLREVLINLCDNAIKFTSTGSVTIAADGVEIEGGRVRLRLEVADTGIGIAAESRQHIFELFTQANTTILDRFGGTGLGLALCERQVRLMGGTIGVESAPNAGSIFWVEVELERAPGAVRPAPGIDMVAIPPEAAWGSAIRSRLALGASPGDQAAGERPLLAFVGEGSTVAPRAGADAAIEVLRTPLDGLPGRWVRERFVTSINEDSSVEELARAVRIASALTHKRATDERQAAPPPLQPAPWAHLAGLRVLVADDNGINRSIVSRMLQGAGLLAVHAVDGEQALELLSGGAVDAALLDVNMPVMDGIEAAQLYNFSAPRRSVPLIALTADATPQTRDKCLAAGMASCLVKPVRTADLLDAIAAVMPHAPEAAPAAAPTPASLSPEETLDLQTLADLHQLGGSEFVIQLVEEFEQDGSAVLEQLEESCLSRNIVDFRTRAHSLCSIAANIGARSLRDLCVPWKDLPESVLNHDAQGMLASVRHEWVVTQSELQSHVASLRLAG